MQMITSVFLLQTSYGDLRLFRNISFAELLKQMYSLTCLRRPNSSSQNVAVVDRWSLFKVAGLTFWGHYRQLVVFKSRPFLEVLLHYTFLVKFQKIEM